jgi:hypothetical protein
VAPLRSDDRLCELNEEHEEWMLKGDPTAEAFQRQLEVTAAASGELTHTRVLEILEVKQLMDFLSGRALCEEGLVHIGHMDEVATVLATALHERAASGTAAAAASSPELRGVIVRESMADANGAGFAHFFGVLYELP